MMEDHNDLELSPGTLKLLLSSSDTALSDNQLECRWEAQQCDLE